MRILIDARLYGLENAGLGRYIINLVEELNTLDKENKYIILLRKKYFNRLKLTENWKKVLADFRHYTFAEQFKLPLILYKERPDIVHFPHFNVPIFYFGKYVVTIHDLLMHRFKSGAVTALPMPFYQVRRLGYNIAFFKVVSGARKIIVPSKTVKRKVLERYKLNPEKVTVTYEGLDYKESTSVKKSSEGKILMKYNLRRKGFFFYVGNAYPHKNLKRAIEATVQLNELSNNKTSGDNIVFVIAGSRDVFKQRLKRVISKLKVQKYVKLLGFVPDRDLEILYRNSIAFVYPSLSEGFGLQGLEAIAAGTLVLASDIPVFKEVYKDSCLYFNPYDFSSIQMAMENVLEMEPKRRDEIIKRGQKFIKRYSWSKMAKQTLKVYGSVLK